MFCCNFICPHLWSKYLGVIFFFQFLFQSWMLSHQGQWRRKKVIVEIFAKRQGAQIHLERTSYLASRDSTIASQARTPKRSPVDASGWRLFHVRIGLQRRMAGSVRIISLEVCFNYIYIFHYSIMMSYGSIVGKQSLWLWLVALQHQATTWSRVAKWCVKSHGA